MRWFSVVTDHSFDELFQHWAHNFIQLPSLRLHLLKWSGTHWPFQSQTPPAWEGWSEGSLREMNSNRRQLSTCFHIHITWFRWILQQFQSSEVLLVEGKSIFSREIVLLPCVSCTHKYRFRSAPLTHQSPSTASLKIKKKIYHLTVTLGFRKDFKPVSDDCL